MRQMNRQAKTGKRSPAGRANRRVATPGAKKTRAPRGPGPIDRLTRFFLRHKSLRRALWLSVVLTAFGVAGVYANKQGYLVTAGGWIDDQARTVSVAMGFAVHDVTVAGRGRTDADAILAALHVERGSALLWFDPEQARASVEALPWVAHARISRLLPGRIHVELAERVPYAIWQNQGELKLIDRTGTIIEGAELAEYRTLPIVVGSDAHLIAHEIVDLVTSEPLIGPRVDAVVRVGGRRWTLKLDNGIEVALPEADTKSALDYLSTLERDHRILDREILAIDLRLPDRMVVRTQDEGAGFRLRSARGEDL